MVVIRLARYGAKKVPKYRITVADQRKWRNSRVIEVLGQYIPSPKGAEKKIVMDLNRVQDWISKGAKPSVRVQKLMTQQKEENKASS